MSSVRAIAKLAKVSVATVSRALNNHPDVDPATRDRVVAAANRARYSPSVGKRLRTVIGLVYPGEPVKADYGAFESQFLAGVMQGVNDERYDVKLINLRRDKAPEETFTQFFMRKGLRGVILRSFDSSQGVCVAVAAENFPSIVVADRFDDPRVNFLCCDSREDSRRAVAHLIKLGHTRIACAVHHVPDTDHTDRRWGYIQALADHNIPLDPSLIFDIVASFDGGVAGINRILAAANPPTAVFFADPLATLGAMRRCQALGIDVPKELSIVGFDDGDIRHHTWPPFTAVCQDARRLGEDAARWLTQSLAHGFTQRMREVRPTMLEINSTTAPPSRRRFRVLPDGSRVVIRASSVRR